MTVLFEQWVQFDQCESTEHFFHDVYHWGSFVKICRERVDFIEKHGNKSIAYYQRGGRMDKNLRTLLWEIRGSNSGSRLMFAKNHSVWWEGESPTLFTYCNKIMRKNKYNEDLALRVIYTL